MTTYYAHSGVQPDLSDGQKLREHLEGVARARSSSLCGHVQKAELSGRRSETQSLYTLTKNSATRARCVGCTVIWQMDEQVTIRATKRLRLRLF